VRGATPLFAALAVALAGAAEGADEHGFFLTLGGGAAVGSVGWTSSATWTEYSETARVDAAYEAGSGPALEAGLGYRLSRRVGLALSFGWARRDTNAQVEASLPHPLYLDRPRSVQGQAAGLSYREYASHFDLLLVPIAGRLEVALFGGPCVLRVDADQVVRVEFDEEYPYDEASFRAAVTQRSRSDAALGWSAGASVGYALTARFGVAAQARYTRAKPELPAQGGTPGPVGAGGTQVTALVRLRF